MGSRWMFLQSVLVDCLEPPLAWAFNEKSNLWISHARTSWFIFTTLDTTPLMMSTLLPWQFVWVATLPLKPNFVWDVLLSCHRILENYGSFVHVFFFSALRAQNSHNTWLFKEIPSLIPGAQAKNRQRRSRWAIFGLGAGGGGCKWPKRSAWLLRFQPYSSS